MQSNYTSMDQTNSRSTFNLIPTMRDTRKAPAQTMTMTTTRSLATATASSASSRMTYHKHRRRHHHHGHNSNKFKKKKKKYKNKNKNENNRNGATAKHQHVVADAWLLQGRWSNRCNRAHRCCAHLPLLCLRSPKEVSKHSGWCPCVMRLLGAIDYCFGCCSCSGRSSDPSSKEVGHPELSVNIITKRLKL